MMGDWNVNLLPSMDVDPWRGEVGRGDGDFLGGGLLKLSSKVVKVFLKAVMLITVWFALLHVFLLCVKLNINFASSCLGYIFGPC